MRSLQSRPQPLRRRRVAGLVTSLLCCAGCGFSSTFSHTLPAGLPSLAGWEKNEERTELAQPSRIVYADPEESVRLGYAPNERLQWDLNGRTLRRFELVPTAQGARWEELSSGTERYTRETGVILGLMGLHRELLFSRASRLR